MPLNWNTHKFVFVAAILMIVAAMVVLLGLKRSDVSDESQGYKRGRANQKRNAVISSLHGKSSNDRKGKRGRRSPVSSVEIDEFADFSPADKKLAMSVQNALDEENFDAVLAAASKALASQNSTLRQHAVEALGWFGEKALVELTSYMADPDENVAEAAVNAWEMALSEVDSAKEKLSNVAMVLPTSASRDTLVIIGGEYSAAANEYIDEVDDESEAAARRVEVLQPIIDIIHGGKPKNVDACKEIYEDITGHEWISFEEASLYVADPENYEPPEDREYVVMPTQEEQLKGFNDSQMNQDNLESDGNNPVGTPVPEEPVPVSPELDST